MKKITLITASALLFLTINVALAGTKGWIDLYNDTGAPLALHEVSQFCIHNGKAGNWAGTLPPKGKHYAYIDSTGGPGCTDITSTVTFSATSTANPDNSVLFSLHLKRGNRVLYNKTNVSAKNKFYGKLTAGDGSTVDKAYRLYVFKVGIMPSK